MYPVAGGPIRFFKDGEAVSSAGFRSDSAVKDGPNGPVTELTISKSRALSTDHGTYACKSATHETTAEVRVFEGI
jgi:hypothetical protein